MSVRPEVLSTKNMIMGFVAVTFSAAASLSLRRPRACCCSTPSSCIAFSCSIAFRPRGVAALSRPSMLAAMFIKMLPVTGCPFGMSGNSLTKTGDSRRASALMSPPCSPIFITPSHSDKTPVRPKEISKAVFDEENVASIIAGNTSISPINTSLAAATTKATRKNAIQI